MFVEIVVAIQQVDFIINVGGDIFVEILAGTNGNVFNQIFVAIIGRVATISGQVFAFRLQVRHCRTQTKIELVLCSHFEVLTFICNAFITVK